VQSPADGDPGRLDWNPGARQGGIRLCWLKHPIDVLAARRTGVVQGHPPERAIAGLSQKAREIPCILLHRGRLVLPGVV
jgi:hypothetical protein